MSKKQMTLIYYHVPEDNDDPDTPNVFGVMINKNNIRLQHLYDYFPLKGSYIFRFKVMYDSSIAWLDLPDLDSKLPTYRDKIMIKATRTSWQTNKQNPYGHYRFIKNQNGQKSTQNKDPQNQKNQKVTSIKQQKKVQPPKIQKKEQFDMNLLDGHHEQPAKSQKTLNLDSLDGDLI